LKRGVGAIAIAAIFGNGWMLSVLKYGIPQDFGAAAPFLDRLFRTRQAVMQIASAGIEDVIISHLTWVHFALFVSAVAFFVLARIYKKGFYFSSFLLIPIGFMIVYFAQNLGFSQLIHPKRGAEYLYLSLLFILACYLKLFIYLPLRLLFRRWAKGVFLVFLYTMFALLAAFVPHYKDTDAFKQYINGVQYSDIPYYLYKIAHDNRPYTWTVVSYVQEYSKVLGKGYMVNVNDFILHYDPYRKYLEIPTPKVYIFVEDIPHKYTGKDEWLYRWRGDIENRLKEWITLYSSTHTNIRIYGHTKLLTVYEIDNGEYMKIYEKRRR
jgi:hypothetical protein